ncbi:MULTISPECIES: class I SAM-dependent rRNA methyltransferase [Anoxybacillus]|uniref:Class I SAM-dependent rRNA methyltransferase n=1 Tax=Anoxybacillus flavithermus TaxID=33934 RepID=A0A178TE48_9BACL|nr:class I SAM-dependent rRNA methyltransferase [Anoxybacillus flavithermus]MBE2906088.1 class I SAM-dependent rRNA methyltransferase [Anoxybacillus flavithermus]MBE2907357.1 class I SAM-dependent rRNA methyltransferase [Anoxybacillus flavithermus]MBE2909896.1 class I SAM-dependent rRNA methyltransferase [Anoxybacillus flavithermus]MBE2913942.1 class I SAM-dependent rRNA methyltransferase [Anoxybacillus flavithermus]MBE2915188.1 class I SAM-dependent rRNA methyltransferase [Anoxybacillus flavi
MANVFLKRKRKKRLELGHPWVFQSEVDYIEGDFEPGDFVNVYNHQRHFLAKGYINPKSQMIVRVLTQNPNDELNAQFFMNRIRQAWAYRERMIPGVRSCRAVYGEADFLPGLIVDKYEDVLVVQILSLGMEKRKEWILQALLDVFQPKAIYLRNDVHVRELEGLKQEKGFWYGTCDTNVQIEENGVKYIVDIENGQKTGFFFDQRQNRAAIKPLITSESTVLDCFTHTGSFMLNACLYGAKHVTAVDISEHAIETAKRNAELNGFTNVDFVVANAFDYLRECVQQGKKWDVVIIDPPAFAKSAHAVPKALAGYKDINLNGLKLVKDGGFFVTASCSYHVHPDMFQAMVTEAAFDAKKILRQIHWSGAGYDHPKLLAADEGDYLKFAIYEVHSRK